MKPIPIIVEEENRRWRMKCYFVECEESCPVCGGTQVYTNAVLDDPGDPGGAASATAFRVARQRGRPKQTGEQPALFDPNEKPKRGKRK